MQRLTVPRYVHAADLPYERSIYKTRVTVGAQGMLTLQCSTKTQLLGAYSQLSGRLQISYCNLAFLGIDFSDTRTVPYYYKGRKESGPT